MPNSVGMDLRIPTGQLWATNPMGLTDWSLRTAAGFTSLADGNQRGTNRNLGTSAQEAACSALSSCCPKKLRFKWEETEHEGVVFRVGKSYPRV